MHHWLLADKWHGRPCEACCNNDNFQHQRSAASGGYKPSCPVSHAFGLTSSTRFTTSREKIGTAPVTPRGPSAPLQKGLEQWPSKGGVVHLRVCCSLLFNLVDPQMQCSGPRSTPETRDSGRRLVAEQLATEEYRSSAMGCTLVQLLLEMQTALVCQGETLALLSFELAAQQAFQSPRSRLLLSQTATATIDRRFIRLGSRCWLRRAALSCCRGARAHSCASQVCDAARLV